MGLLISFIKTTSLNSAYFYCKQNILLNTYVEASITFLAHVKIKKKQTRKLQLSVLDLNIPAIHLTKTIA